MAEDALPEDQQERQREERRQHGVCRQPHAGHGQSLVRPTSGKIVIHIINIYYYY